MIRAYLGQLRQEWAGFVKASRDAKAARDLIRAGHVTLMWPHRDSSSFACPHGDCQAAARKITAARR